MSTTPQWVTLAQIAEVTGHHQESVRRALHATGLMPARIKGVRGHRLTLANANRFIARQWPGAPLIKPAPAEVSQSQPDPDHD
jgi:hypothetical protein